MHLHEPSHDVSPPATEGTTSTGITGDHRTHLLAIRRRPAGAVKGRRRRRAQRACPRRHPAASGILCSSTGPKRGRPPSTNAGRAVCPIQASVGAGEEPLPLHRVGPWYPVVPVELVPTLTGGDTRRAEDHRCASRSAWKTRPAHETRMKVSPPPTELKRPAVLERSA
jgi:hypothetical protein